jgi:hypothetical protein
MTAALFEFFETVADELSSEPTRVITRESFRINDEEPPLLEDLKRGMKASDTTDAIQKAVKALEVHFETRGAKLPFSYDAASGRFTALDVEYLQFVKEMGSIRSLGGKSRVFECGVARRLAKRATGGIHRVGHPRDAKKTKKAFNKHLVTLGFEKPVLLGQEKDGGFDILWMLPIGALPHRPLVSVQCKNGEFSMGEADKSVGAGSRSLSQHGGLQPQVHVPCVLFNDYIWRERLTKKQLNWVPLGLTDLAAMAQPAVNLSLI